MNHVRQHEKNRQASSTERITLVQTRIRAKKEEALAQGPDSWESRLSHKARSLDWELKQEEIRERIKEKRSSASKQLWSGT